MKTIGRFAIPVLLSIAIIIGAGNQVMTQMTALAGEEYAPVLAWEWAQNAIDQIKSTIQSAAEGVKYGIDR